MKSLKQICEDNITHSAYEVSILEDINDQINAYDNSIIDRIEKWITENYDCTELKISDKPNLNGLYEVTAKKVKVKNKNITSLTNGLFEWSKVKNFYCDRCTSLTSLEGAPKEIVKDFSCIRCTSLTSLKGAPVEVGGNFDTDMCINLKSLEGCPKKVGKDFICANYRSWFTEEDITVRCTVKGEIW